MRSDLRGKAIAVAAAVWLVAEATFAQPASWSTSTEPFRIVDGIYYVGTEGLASYLIVTPQGHILIDGALRESVPQIEASVEKLGFALRDIKILLNSHAHYDHSGGLAQLKEDTGATLAAMEGDVSALEGGFYLGSETVAEFQAPPVKVDRVLHDGDTVELGGTVLRAHLTPGHTRGCTSWGVTGREGGESYEVLVFCSASVAANRIAPPLQYEGIVADYRATFAKAKRMKVDVPLAPHPEFFGLLDKRDRNRSDPSRNAFIEPGRFALFIAASEAAFEKALAERTSKAKPGTE